MKYSAQELLLADRLLVLAEGLRAVAVTHLIPQEGEDFRELLKEITAAESSLPIDKYILLALEKLEEVMDIVTIASETPQPKKTVNG